MICGENEVLEGETTRNDVGEGTRIRVGMADGRAEGTRDKPPVDSDEGAEIGANGVAAVRSVVRCRDGLGVLVGLGFEDGTFKGEGTVFGSTEECAADGVFPCVGFKGADWLSFVG